MAVTLFGDVALSSAACALIALPIASEATIQAAASAIWSRLGPRRVATRDRAWVLLISDRA
jgi:hypothetical protein